MGGLKIWLESFEILNPFSEYEGKGKVKFGCKFLSFLNSHSPKDSIKELKTNFHSFSFILCISSRLH